MDMRLFITGIFHEVWMLIYFFFCLAVIINAIFTEVSKNSLTINSNRKGILNSKREGILNSKREGIINSNREGIINSKREGIM